MPCLLSIDEDFSLLKFDYHKLITTLRKATGKDKFLKQKSDKSLDSFMDLFLCKTFKTMKAPKMWCMSYKRLNVIK